MSSLRRSLLVLAVVPFLVVLAHWRSAAGQQTVRPAGSPGVTPAAGGEALAPYVTWSGPDSAISSAEYAIARNDADWQNLWERHLGQTRARESSPRMSVPRVDFSRCMVVGLFTGNRTNCNGVSLSSIQEQGGRVVLRFDESTYQVAFGPGERPQELPMVHPYAIFVLPRSDKPIEVQENVQGLKDSPEKWKTRATL